LAAGADAVQVAVNKKGSAQRTVSVDIFYPICKVNT
jgi:hypothetical protein